MTKEKQYQLKKKIENILKEIGHMSDIKQNIGKEFMSRNLSATRAIMLFQNPDYLYTLTDSDDDIRFLFLFSVALRNAIENKVNLEFDIREYFTKLEYSQWINYKEESEPEELYPLVFEDMQQLANRMWQGKMTAQRIAKLDDKNILLYNFKTQRSPKYTVAGIKIDLDKKKVKEIRKRILEGRQFPDHIRLNVLRNFQEKIQYNPKTQELIIGEGSIINVVDGQHRKVANSLVVEENPDIDFTWGVIITNYTENEIRDYILQINKQKPIKKEQIKSWDMDRKENLVVSVIADDRISKLARVMKEQLNEVKLNKGLTTRNIIAEAISENYVLDDTTDIRELGNWIVEFTDYLMGLYPEAFITNPYHVKETSVINHKNIFYGYIALSAKLCNNKSWKEITREKMETIDFDINNPQWRGLMNKGKLNKTSRTKIYNLFVEGL